MNILVVLYYRSMAEYFMDLEDALREINPRVRFQYHALYPCAWIALRKAGRPVHFVRPRKHEEPYGDPEDPDRVFGYHETILGKDVRSELEDLYQGYLAHFECRRQKDDLAGAILVGDSRLAVMAAEQVMRSHDIPVLYWEQGPFQTTQLSPNGVNYNAKFELVDSAQPVPPAALNTAGPRKVFRRTLASSLGTWLTNSMSSRRWPSRIVPLDRVSQLSQPLDKSVADLIEQVHEMPQGAYVYMLQVPYDNQIVEFGGLGRDVTVALEILLSRIPENRILIRQHPLHALLYPRAFYELCDRHNVRFSDELPLDRVLDHAEGVIVSNSTVGAEAMERGRKVLLLGDAYYANPNVNFSLTGNAGDQDTLDRFLVAPVYERSRADYIRFLVSQNLFPGHYLYEHAFDERLPQRILQEFTG